MILPSSPVAVCDRGSIRVSLRRRASIMQLHKYLHTGVILAVSVGMLAAGTVQAEPPANASVAAKKPVDVELQAGGRLVGRLVDGHGNGLPAARVVLHSGATVIADAQSDPTGNF